jgi:hypothetical protein
MAEQGGAQFEGAWVDAGDGWDLGQGITSFDGQTRQKAVEVAPGPSTALARTTSIYLAESREDIYNALEVEVSTQASYGLASASATYSMAESVRTTGFDLYLVVFASALYPRQSPPQNPQLHDDAKNILAAGQYATFVRLYGDRFIDGLQTGGMYAGILQIHAQTEDVRSQIKTGLSAGGAGGELSGSVSVNVTQTMTSFKSFASTEVTAKSFGGAPISQSVDLSAMLNAALSFSDTITPENAYPLYAHLTDYTELDIPNAGGFADFVDKFTNPNAILLQRQQDTVLLQDRLGTSQFANDNPEGYAAPASDVRALVAPDLRDLQPLIHTINGGTNQYLDGLQTALTHDQDPTTVQEPAAYTMPAPLTMPSLEPGIAFTVRSGTGFRLCPAAGNGDVTALGVTYSPGVVLADPDDTDVAQRWMVGPGTPPSSGGEVTLRLVNGSSKESLTTKTIGGTPVVGLFEQDSGPIWDVLLNNSGDQSLVIRLLSNTDLNLNALGGDWHPETPVGVWSWSGGAKNEIWYCDPVTPKMST